MKNFKFLVAFVLVAAMMAVSAFATITLNFDVEEATTLDTGDACYKIVVTQSDDEGDWRALQTKIAFNYDKIIPVDTYDASVPDFSGEGAVYPFVFNSFKTGRTNTDISTPSDPAWVIDGANSSVVVETYWSKVDTYPVTADNTMIYEMYFKYADGVVQKDLVEGDFVVTYVEYANGVFNYAGNADESKNNVVVNNNVVPVVVPAVYAKLPVAAGDTVYVYGEGEAMTVAEVAEAGTYDVEAKDSTAIVVVNSGYDAQKFYYVGKAYADPYYEEVDSLANGVLGNIDVSVRYRDPFGIRFYGQVSAAVNATEYGFIMTAESAANALDEDYVLDMALVEAGKAKKGVAYDENTDIYMSRDAQATYIAGVMHGIPMTAAAVQTTIVSRPYYIDAAGTVVYGEETSSTLYDIAKAIYGLEGFEMAQDYAKEVIELVEGPMDEETELATEIAIDVGALYE